MKGDEGCIFTLYPQASCVYRHSRRKDEGLNRISILNFLRYKDFSKRNLPHLFSNKTSKYTFTQKLLHTFPIKPLQTLPIKRK